jgi:glycosyltransferase involved in cell wall biosynthesis
MTQTIPIAFVSPLKAPDHPVPSGDRTVCRLMLAALRRAGFAPEIVTRLRMFEGAGDREAMTRLRQAAEAEAARYLADVAGRPAAGRPVAVFAYHVHYKAPDVAGRIVARELAIPYVLAEASRAPKRAVGPFALHHALAEEAVEAADLVFATTARDRVMLDRLAPARQRLLDLPPFIDTRDWPDQPRPARPVGEKVRLVAVGMMRAGDKLASYRELAAALACLPASGWTLDVAGDGPARTDVEAALAPLAGRVRFCGALGREDLAQLYAASDIAVWPAVNEAYGMALVEAGAMGLPVVAGRVGGVPDVVRDGETGLLVAPGDPQAFAGAVLRLIADADLRRRMGAAAQAFVRGERSLEQAARRLRGALLPLVAAGPGRVP